MALSDELEALAKRHGALSYRNRADSQPALPKITAEDRSFLHDNPNTDDVVKWVQDYACAAVSADRAARATADSQPAPANTRQIAECYGDCPTDPKTCANPCKFEGRAARAPADSVTAPAGAGVAHALSDGQIEAMPVWRNFVGLWPESRREIVDAVVDLLTTPPAQAADSVLEDAARLDWLLLHISGAEFRRIGVHYSGNARRADVDAARKQGANHD